MQDRIRKLSDTIRQESSCYYSGKPIVSDSVFDKHVAELRSLDPSNPVLKEIGAAAKVGSVKHPERMGSLDKVNTIDAVWDWVEKSKSSISLVRSGLIAMPKMDGAAGRISYIDGDLVCGASRGDGETGTDLTVNVKEIKNIPKHIPNCSGLLHVYGEFVISKKHFASLLAKGDDHKNPRNLATGTICATEHPELVNERGVDFVAYSASGNFSTAELSKNLAWLGKIGFQTVTYFMVPNKEAFTYIVARYLSGEREKFPYQIDGLVVAFDSNFDRADMGWDSGNHHPLGMMAFKFPGVEATTTVTGIEIGVGKSGAICPVLLIDPTEVDGSIISRVSVHNFANLNDFGCGVGSQIVIKKDGDVIPGVVRVIKKAPLAPNMVMNNGLLRCPVCGGNVSWADRIASCSNPSCKGKLVGRITHWCGTVGILGIGDVMANALVDKGLVTDLIDLYMLSPVEWGQVTGSSDSANKLFHAVMSKHTMTLATFLHALGLDGIGNTNSQVIASHFQTVEKLIDRLSLWGASDKINYLAKPTSDRVVRSLQDNMKDLEMAKDCLTIAEPVAKSGRLSGQKICLTGTMSKERAEITKMIEDAGGTVVNSVNKMTNILVQADPASQTTKSKSAMRIGIPVISEQELYMRI